MMLRRKTQNRIAGYSVLNRTLHPRDASQCFSLGLLYRLIGTSVFPFVPVRLSIPQRQATHANEVKLTIGSLYNIKAMVTINAPNRQDDPPLINHGAAQSVNFLISRAQELLTDLMAVSFIGVRVISNRAARSSWRLGLHDGLASGFGQRRKRQHLRAGTRDIGVGGLGAGHKRIASGYPATRAEANDHAGHGVRRERIAAFGHPATPAEAADHASYGAADGAPHHGLGIRSHLNGNSCHGRSGAIWSAHP